MQKTVFKKPHYLSAMLYGTLRRNDVREL